MALYGGMAFTKAEKNSWIAPNIEAEIVVGVFGGKNPQLSATPRQWPSA